MATHDHSFTQLLRTPLYEQHLMLGARMVGFSGWEMPVQYSGISQEHQAVRTRAGLFDVSHMGEFHVEGPGALTFLQHLVPNDVSRLALNQCLYTQFCQDDAGVIDDLLIYRLNEQTYMLVVNAGNIAEDFAWVQQQIRTFPDVTLTNQSATTALLALQGPMAQTILQPLTEQDLAGIGYYHCNPGMVAGIPCLLSRTGYTGEDGFELYCASTDAVALWQALLAAGAPQGLLAAGLGARDTLRLEAGMCLYGHELDRETNPLEARLGWSVKLGKDDFIGRSALLQVKQQSPQRLLVGVELLERGVPRSGYAIFHDGQQIGTLTSGAPGLTVHKQIGMGYVTATYATVGTTVQITIRDKQVAAQIVALPFYKRSNKA